MSEIKNVQGKNKTESWNIGVLQNQVCTLIFNTQIFQIFRKTFLKLFLSFIQDRIGFGTTFDSDLLEDKMTRLVYRLLFEYIKPVPEQF